MLHLLLRHTDAIIGNRDDRLLLAESERYINLASHLIIFNGVGEQVVDNLIHLVGIKPCGSFRIWLVELQPNLLMFSHRTDILAGIFYKGNQVAAAHEQMQLSCLRLSHFQNLSQESGGAVDVAVHHEIVFLILWCHRLELVDGGRDDGKRGKQLVGDIGEDDSHLQAVSGLHPFLIPSGSPKDAANEHQDIEHEGYSGSIPWRQHLDGDGVWQLLPLTIAVGGLQAQSVGS